MKVECLQSPGEPSYFFSSFCKAFCHLKKKQIVAETATGRGYPRLSSDELGKEGDQKDELRSWLGVQTWVRKERQEMLFEHAKVQKRTENQC